MENGMVSKISNLILSKIKERNFKLMNKGFKNLKILITKKNRKQKISQLPNKMP